MGKFMLNVHNTIDTGLYVWCTKTCKCNSLTKEVPFLRIASTTEGHHRIIVKMYYTYIHVGFVMGGSC